MSTSSHSQPSSMSRSSSQANCMDPLDALVDYSEYEQMSYQSPSISPSASSKPQYVRPVASTPTANNALLPSSQQTLSGPSHNYDMYKQQTGIPSGAIANTLAMNPTNMYNYNYMSGINSNEDFLDFNQTASFDGLTANMELEFDSPSASPAFFYPEQSLASSSEYVNPSVIGGQENQVMPPTAVLPTQTSNVGRLWPGMHQQQAALAKAQQQQKQQQQLIQQQRQQSMSQQAKPQRPKSHQASDPLVEEKISQLLNSMRQSSVSTSDDNDNAHGGAGMAHVHRMRKEEEDMDEDERLLASEEGKKLSSKERRQLRNKVSARAFRSRRKEYIGQLEGEIAGKVNENTDLRMQNRALMEENTRLSDLTRMLLSSPSFSGFLDTLTPNVANQAQQAQPTPTPVEQQRPAQAQVRKDVNPYAAQAQLNNQHINMAIIPEHTMDFSMLDLNGDGGYSYQPQVFSVLEVPEAPIDVSILSGKSSNFVGQTFANEEKVEIPVIERPAVVEVQAVEETEVDEEFDADPMFSLFSQSSPSTAPVELEPSVFGGIESEKALAHFYLVDAVDDSAANLAMARVERLCSKLDPVMARLEALTLDL